MSDAAFVGSIPDLYERYLGPMLFEPYARDLARRFEGFEGDLLETAAGTGRVTRALAKAAPRARILATDLNQPMLDTAAGLTAAANVEWRQADAQALPFEGASFDAVVCQFGVMFFPDKAAGFSQARRVLRPGGRFVFNVWDDIAANEISQIVGEAVAGLFPKDPPRFLERTPFGYHDRATIAAALAAAGFAAPQFDVVRLQMRSPSAADAAVGLCTGTPLRGEIEARDPEGLDAATEAASAALTEAFGGGEIVGWGQAVVVSAGAT
ncbi:class I SAM-dependent methyltransferase [Phenylobacterium sp. NIBR 498073]|uniref:class I SAM-dependent methyltransferase n=1 Tax=Phenylobacterium sp. NIBR 498073 TaxID=3015177 RepID=UPI0022B2F3BC|nr:class I SAM-dependent methyltransferase [Phenylobacterium sp. NIBR 498073]WGU40139.1 class I SAM-dependent methyltransferase [Phenylobacterium sp. NIBR 498073]